MRPSLRQLEYLVALAGTLHFGRAAEASFVSPPGLSAQIQQLERMLGVTLFERDRRTVLATPAGLEAAARARRILSMVDDLVEGARHHREPLTGTLRLGVIPTVAPYLLPRALPAVRRRFPKLRLLLREDGTRRLVEDLAAGKVDVLLLALEAELGDAHRHPLFRDPFLLAMPAGHRLAGRKRLRDRDLQGEDLLLLEDGHWLREQALAACKVAGASEVGDFRASSLPTLLEMVTGGVGATLLPALAAESVRRTHPQVALVPFGASGPGRTIGLAWRPTSTRTDEFTRLGDVISGAGV